MLYRYSFTMTTRHIVAVTDDYDLGELGVLYVTNSLHFDSGRRVLGSEDVQFEVRILREAETLEALETEWTELYGELEFDLADCEESEDPLRFLLVDQDVSFGFDIEADAGLTMETLEEGMDWDLQYESDSDDCCLLGNATIGVSAGRLAALN